MLFIQHIGMIMICASNEAPKANKSPCLRKPASNTILRKEEQIIEIFVEFVCFK